MTAKSKSPFDRIIDTIEWLAAMFVGIVAANIFIAVILRKFFDASIPDSYDFGRMLLGILIFWGLAATNFSWDRIWTKPLLPADLGWISVLNAIPYCLWWLVIIETVSVASEETQDTTRSIPRGLVWGQLTLIGLIGPTWFFACGAVQNAQSIVTDANGEDISYPLSKVIRDIPIGQNLLLVYGNECNNRKS